MITMHRQMLGALARHFNLPQGLLGAAFMDEPADPGYAAQVAQWHSALPDAEKIPLSALRVLAAPALVADVRAFLGRETLIRTWAVCGADGEGPLVLAAASGEDGELLKLNWSQTREEFADTLLVWLIEAGEPSEPEMKVELSQAESPRFSDIIPRRVKHGRPSAVSVWSRSTVPVRLACHACSNFRYLSFPSVVPRLGAGNP